MGDEPYLHLLNCFCFFMVDEHCTYPAFVYAKPNMDICTVCSEPIVEGDAISWFTCYRHALHCACMQAYINSGGLTCTLCRERGRLPAIFECSIVTDANNPHDVVITHRRIVTRIDPFFRFTNVLNELSEIQLLPPMPTPTIVQQQQPEIVDLTNEEEEEEEEEPLPIPNILRPLRRGIIPRPGTRFINPPVVIPPIDIVPHRVALRIDSDDEDEEIDDDSFSSDDHSSDEDYLTDDMSVTDDDDE
jgi:hypothetical protein